MRINQRIGLIVGVPADIRNKFIAGSGVGSCNKSVRRAKIMRASHKRTCTTSPILNTQIQCMATQNQLTAETAIAIVITCIDFRLIDDAVLFFNSIGLNNNYDEFILAGASLGYNQTLYSAWTETLDKHIELSKQLHNISEVIVLDHMKCGAYKLFYNLESIDRAKEIAMHKDNFIVFTQTINRKYPTLKVSTYLMDLDGKLVAL